MPVTTYRSFLRDIVLFLILAAGMVLLVERGGQELSYTWHWYRIPGYFYSIEDGQFILGPLLRGLIVTFEVTALSLLLAGIIGIVTAMLRLSSSIVGRCIARIYLETIRNTPLLVQIFFLYFVMAPVLDIGRFTTAVLALSLFEGAYASEIIRSGIVSIPQGQWEAARSLGLQPSVMYRKIILPQAIRQILPPLTSQAVSLIKDSSLVSTIAVYDITMEGRTIIAETFLTFEIWFSVAAVYLVLALMVSFLASMMEKIYPQR